MEPNPQHNRASSHPARAPARPWTERLFDPIDNASITVFRICFGAIMLWEVSRYFRSGWIESHWIAPQFFFKFYGFEWVTPWPGNWMYLHFVFLGALAVCITLGLWFRASTILFFPAFTYIFLLDQTWYLNHFYMITLVSLLMIFIPAHRAVSLDGLRNPAIRSNHAPAWTLWLLQFQVGVVYFFGGVAKLNMDWLRGEPMRVWLSQSTDFPVIGGLFTEEWMVYLFSYGGLLLDLCVVPLLLWPRTRNIAFAATLGFHLMNARLFHIGIFPWFMICATLLYFPPDWPRRVGLLPWPDGEKKQKKRKGKEKAKLTRGERPLVRPFVPEPWIGCRATIVLLGLFVVYHFFMPMRYLLYPGNPNWTGQGLSFSWRMKLSHKRTKTELLATNPTTGEQWKVNLSDYLTGPQISGMATEPDRLRQFSHFLAQRLREEGHQKVEVRAEVRASLNRREPQLLVDPNVDLAAEPGGLGPVSWVLPLEQPFVYRKPVGRSRHPPRPASAARESTDSTRPLDGRETVPLR